MDLTALISQKLNEPIIELKADGQGWYTIVREEQPQSTRYSFALFNSLKGKYGIIYDRKEGSSIRLDMKNYKGKLKTIKNKETPKQTSFVNKDVIEALKLGSIKDANNYLKNHKLDSFIHDKVLWRTIKNKSTKSDWIVVPYTTFDLFPKPIGAQAYRGKGKENKKFFKSKELGAYKGSFHPHKFSKANKVWVLGEGFLDCFLASRILEDCNVLEVGGASKYKEIIKYIARNNPDDTIILLGEEGIENQLDKLRALSPNLKIGYPLECKDFSDYYAKTGDISKTREAMLCQDISQDTVQYKPLGIANGEMVVYSKIYKTVVILNPDHLNKVIRACDKTEGFEEMDILDKQRFANRVFTECVKEGEYKPDYIKGIGFWKYNDKHYFNTGEIIYEKKGNVLAPTLYGEVINNEFLPVKMPTTFKFLIKEDFDIAPIEKVFEMCDWKYKSYGSLILGFIAQSIFAGVIPMRPNMWIMSNGSTAGKTWLSDWICTWLMPMAKTRESNISTPAGTRQTMANNSILLHCDELGEEGSSSTNKAKEMIEILRSASTSKNPMLFGSAEQKAIYQWIRFSTLLSVIDGTSVLQEQDWFRLIFIYLKVGDKKNFYENILPAFKAIENNKTKAFPYFCLSNYELYEKYMPVFEKLLSSYRIGHRIRGLASCLAGYAMLHKDLKKGKELLSRLISEDPEMFKSFRSKEEEKDYFITLLNSEISKNMFGFEVEHNIRFITAAKKDLLKEYGVAIDNNERLFLSIRLAESLLKKQFGRNVDLSVIRRMLSESPRYLKMARKRFNGSDSPQLHSLVFDVSGTA